MKLRSMFLGCLLALSAVAYGQNYAPITQTLVMAATAAPPALLNSQSYSSSTATGFFTSTTGGSIAAGTYRCGVTFFTSTNTETPLSIDTATTSAITTTGTTSTVTIQAPLPVGVGANVVGWRPYCGVSGGATATETLVTINATVCTLASSSTPSCSLNSPAVLTLQTQFVAGSGGPATPGTALYQPVSNAAATAIYEGSNYTFHSVTWTVSGTAPSACSFQLQSGTTVAGLANIGQAVTCTASGTYSLPITNSGNTFFAVNIPTFTAGDLTTKVTYTYYAQQFPLTYTFWGNAVPTSNCTNGVSFTNLGASSASTALYVCQPANTWTAVVVP